MGNERNAILAQSADSARGLYLLCHKWELLAQGLDFPWTNGREKLLEKSIAILRRYAIPSTYQRYANITLHGREFPK